MESRSECEVRGGGGSRYVALDVARIPKTADELKPTDIACHALEQLKKLVEDIYIGASSPAQVKFTLHEIKSLVISKMRQPRFALKDLDLTPQRADLNETSWPALMSCSFGETVHTQSGAAFIFCSKPRRWSFTESKGGSIKVVANRLEEQEGGYIQSIPTDSFRDIPCGLVMRSVGYHGPRW